MKIFSYYKDDPCANTVRALGIASFIVEILSVAFFGGFDTGLGWWLLIAGGILLYLAKRINEHNVIKKLKKNKFR